MRESFASAVFAEGDLWWGGVFTAGRRTWWVHCCWRRVPAALALAWGVPALGVPSYWKGWSSAGPMLEASPPAFSLCRANWVSWRSIPNW